MTFTGGRYLLLAAVVALCADVVLSCMCMPAHPQTQFCNSDFVFRGKIILKNTLYEGADPSAPTKIVYQIQPREIYRDNGSSIKLKIGDTVNVATSGYESTCSAVTMERGASYVVSAKEINGQLITTLCSWNVQFNALTPPQKKMLRKEYSQTCNQTTPCEVRKHCGATPPHTCEEFNGCTYYEEGDCNVQTSYCDWENGECSWAWSWPRTRGNYFRNKYSNCARRQTQ